MRKLNRNFNKIRALSVGAVPLLMVFLMNPMVDSASAVLSPNGMNGYEIDLNAGGDLKASSVSITMGNSTGNGQLDASSTDPNKSSSLVKRTASIEIGATDGYTVALSGNPNLTGTDTNNKIPTVTSNTTLAQMMNQWGWYSVEGNVDCSALQALKQMKTNGDIIASGTLSAKATKEFTMCFGARVDGNQAADTYSNTVTLSVVASPKEVKTFSGITKMQEMTASICSTASVNDTAFLEDTRDGKKYWVTKLADGNCWMSQNLALDIVTSGSGTAMTSNINTSTSDIVASDVHGGVNWGGNTSYPPESTVTNLSSLGTSSTNTSSYRAEYVLNTPTTASSCGGFSGVTGLDKCSDYGFVNISGGWVSSGDPNFYRRELYLGTDGSTCTKSANNAVNPNATGACRIYDAHYLVGNYYSWNAATAGTGGEIADASANGSICPKNWKLPNGKVTTSGTFTYLLSHYGISNKPTGSIYDANYDADVMYNIALSPLFFVRSGWADGSSDIIAYAADTARYWSTHTYSSGSPYELQFSANVVVPNGSNNSYRGESVRCVAR